MGFLLSFTYYPPFLAPGGMGGWEGPEYHLAASFMVPHCPSFGNETPLIFSQVVNGIAHH